MLLWSLVLCGQLYQSPTQPAPPPTRASTWTLQRQAKAAAPPPTAAGGLEALLFRASNDRWIERLFQPRTGPFVAVASAGAGSPLGLGPGWTFSPPDYGITVAAAMVGSVDRSWTAQATLRMPDVVPALGRDRLAIALSARHDVRAEDEYWGLGDRPGRVATYRLSSSTVEGAATYRMTPALKVTAGGAYDRASVGPSRSRFDGVFDVHDATTAPGLFATPTYRRIEVGVDFDQRDTVPSSRTGLHLAQPALSGASTGRRIQVAYARHADVDGGTWSFARTTIDVQQYATWLHGHRVLALRALAEITSTGSASIVPFFLLPTAGGSRIGRADPTFRFRDRHLMAVQAEYRYLLNPFMHGALFVDAVEVVPALGALSWRSIRWTGGVGLRVGARGGAALRLDLAFGRSGPRVAFGAGHAF